MADKVIDSELLLLVDQWGPVFRLDDIPTDGFDGTTHFNVATKAYPQGLGVAVYHKGTAGDEGYSIFRYLRSGTNSGATVTTIVAKDICTQQGTTPFLVTKDPDAVNATTVTQEGRCAIGLGTMVDARYGFFWTGGVCPETLVSGLGGTYPTDDSVIFGKIAVGNAAADTMCFQTSQAAGTGKYSPFCGYAGGADVTGY